MNRVDLRLRIRQRADMVNSSFVSDSEIDGFIDTSIADLYDFLVSEYGDEKFAKNAWIVVRRDWVEAYDGNWSPSSPSGASTNPNVAWPNNVQGYLAALGTSGEILLLNMPSPANGIPSGFMLPPDFLRMVRVHWTTGYAERVEALVVDTEEPLGDDLAIATPDWRLVTTSKTFWPMHTIELCGQVIDTNPRAWKQSQVAYRLVHGPHQIALGYPSDATMALRNQALIQFLPVPSGRYAVQFFYVPKPRVPSGDTEELAYDFPDWIIFDCAAECLEKQESDSRSMRARLERVKDRIRNNARTLDAGQVPQVVDVYGSNRLERNSLTDPWED